MRKRDRYLKKGNSHLHFENNWRIPLKCKRSQQEIVGFIVIVMLIVIVGVIFLGISLRNSQKPTILTEDNEISNFLLVTSKYTTDCVVNEPFKADIDDLLKEQNKNPNAECASGRKVKEVIIDTYSNILNYSQFRAASDRPVKYSRITFNFYQDIEDPSQKIQILEPIEQGENAGCLSRRGGRYQSYASPGDVVTELEICG